MVYIIFFKCRLYDLYIYIYAVFNIFQSFEEVYESLVHIIDIYLLTV